MADQQYCLRWNNHHPNFISVFKNLLDLEELVDVTLSVDGQHIKAHKVILSACSPYFKLIFSVNPCKHPVVILSGIKFTNLKTIVEFMYCGEINISDEQLPDILEVAESLQVRGLYDPNKKVNKSQRSPTKKEKKKIQTLSSNISSQSDVPQQRLEGDVGNNHSSPTSDSCIEWTQEEFKEEIPDDYTSESSSSVQITILPSHMGVDGELNGMFQPDQTMQTVSSITPHTTSPETSPGPNRRRSSKVQESKNFQLALEAVRSGQLGFCKAAKLYGLNNRTLWLEYKKRGYPTTRSQPVGLKQKSTLLGKTS